MALTRKKSLPIRAVLSVADYGAVSLHVSALTFGMQILSTESGAKFSKALYVQAMTADSFGVSVTCYSRAEYEKLGKFIQGYGHGVATGRYGPARLVIPSYKFDRTGIPNGVSLGDDVRAVTYRLNIGFVGARDLLSLTTKDVTQVSNILGAEYLNAIHHDAQAAYYYPSGSQLSGSQYGTDTLYDSHPSTADTEGDTREWEAPDVMPSGKVLPAE